jgi:2-polyprenyl-3-methyl-5-hydroxy-6-metoxy-1,4-benzoquinol methylase
MPKEIVCNFCGNKENILYQKSKPPYNVVKCTKCGLVYTNPQPDLDFLEEHYNKEYYDKWIKEQFVSRQSLWKKRLRMILKYKNCGNLLDVGCGVGTFLYYAKENGFNVYGTEVSEYAVKFIYEKYNIKVEKKLFNQINFENDFFDVITFWHSLEHVKDPYGDICHAYNILKNNGLLVIACPNLNNYLMRIAYRILKRKELLLFTPDAKEQHLFHFSENVLKNIIKKAGFKVIKIKPDLSKIELSKKIIDILTALIYLITRKNYGDAFIIIAKKP